MNWDRAPELFYPDDTTGLASVVLHNTKFRHVLYFTWFKVYFVILPQFELLH